MRILSQCRSGVLAIMAVVAGCDSSGGGAPASTIRYAGDEPAFGVVIRSGGDGDAAGAAGDAITCIASAAATEAGCEAEIGLVGAGLRLALYGCFVEAGDALFECEATATELAEIFDDAGVHAGCGCQARCPEAPAIAVCDAGDEDCEDAAVLAPASTGADRNSTGTTSSATGETTCSTCCDTDYYPDVTGNLVVEEPITEIELEVTYRDECIFDFSSCFVLNASEWARVTRPPSSPGNNSRFCLAARNPTEAPASLPLLSCKADTITRTEFLRVVGENFEPVATPPQLVFEED